MRRVSAALLWACLLGPAGAQTLTVASWGSLYEHGQTEAYFKPFTTLTGIGIQVETYNGGLSELREQQASGQVRWDLIDLLVADNIAACEQGLLRPLDHARLPPAPDGTPAADDFIAGGLTECGVSQIVWAIVLAYNDDAFPGEKPTRADDLFDLTRFPGKRALQRAPIANLEWALLSYGVPREDIYPLLSTERGLRLAFKRLDLIKDEIVWWHEVSEPARLLADGEVVMASGYNGRFFHAAVVDRQPTSIIWHGQLYNFSTWGIPKDAPNGDAAERLMRFATDTQRLADQARYIAYGPARASSARHLPRHAASGLDLRPHLPTYPANLRYAIRKDHEWYAKTEDRLQARFDAWVAGE